MLKKIKLVFLFTAFSPLFLLGALALLTLLFCASAEEQFGYFRKKK